MSLPDRLNSAREWLTLSGILTATLAFFVRGWGAFIGFLSSPLERSLAQREAKALRQDNNRLALENQTLRAALYGISGDGSSKSEGGTPNSP